MNFRDASQTGFQCEIQINALFLHLKIMCKLQKSKSQGFFGSWCLLMAVYLLECQQSTGKMKRDSEILHHKAHTVFHGLCYRDVMAATNIGGFKKWLDKSLERKAISSL